MQTSDHRSCLEKLLRRAQANLKAGIEEDVDTKRYVNPAFNFDDAEHKELLEAAANVDAVLKGDKGDDVRGVPVKPVRPASPRALSTLRLCAAAVFSLLCGGLCSR